MDLRLSEQHRALQAEIREFIRQYGHKSPKPGGGRKRPDQKTLDWQKLLVQHGFAARILFDQLHQARPNVCTTSSTPSRI